MFLSLSLSPLLPLSKISKYISSGEIFFFARRLSLSPNSGFLARSNVKANKTRQDSKLWYIYARWNYSKRGNTDMCNLSPRRYSEAPPSLFYSQLNMVLTTILCKIPLTLYSFASLPVFTKILKLNSLFLMPDLHHQQPCYVRNDVLFWDMFTEFFQFNTFYFY